MLNVKFYEQAATLALENYKVAHAQGNERNEDRATRSLVALINHLSAHGYIVSAVTDGKITFQKRGY